MKSFGHRTKHRNPKHEFRNPKRIPIFEMFKIENAKKKAIYRFENLNLGFVSSWSETDASPDIRNSSFRSKGRERCLSTNIDVGSVRSFLRDFRRSMRVGSS